MTPEQLTRTLQLLKEAQGKPGLLKKIWKTTTGASEAAAKQLEREGHELASKLVKYSPHIGVGAAGYATWKSDPVQRMRYKYQLWKARRAQRRAMRGYR